MHKGGVLTLHMTSGVGLHMWPALLFMNYIYLYFFNARNVQGFEFFVTSCHHVHCRQAQQLSIRSVYSYWFRLGIQAKISKLIIHKRNGAWLSRDYVHHYHTASAPRLYKWFGWKIRVLRMTSQNHVQYASEWCLVCKLASEWYLDCKLTVSWRVSGIWTVSWRALLQTHTWELHVLLYLCVWMIWTIR